MHVQTMPGLRRWPQTASARQAYRDELTGRGKPLTMASSGNPLIENAAGNQDDDHANERHAVFVASIRCRPLDAVDHQEFDRAALGLEPEPELFLHRREDRR